MSAHWDFMVPHFTGDMVTIIGDDDGLMPGAIRKVSEIVHSHGLKPIQHALGGYGWPDNPHEKLANKFWFFNHPGANILTRKSKDFLVELCRAQVRYSNGPCIYHGFIPRNIINRLQINGSVFHRSAPDVYSAITIALQTEDFISAEEVLTISGMGAKSNGLSVFDGGLDGTLFMTETLSPRYFPRYNSRTVQLHVLDSILEASTRYSAPEMKDWINYGEHFCKAANECLDMPIRSQAAKEMLLVLWQARKNKCLHYLFLNRGAKLIEKIRFKFTGKPRDTNQDSARLLYKSDVLYEMPAEVTDIYSASNHLHELLMAGSKT